MFAFEWTDADTYAASQPTWTVLPQGFKDSPHIFHNALVKELRELQLINESFLQHVDDLLTSSPTREDSNKNTIQVPSFLGKRGYWVSPHKAQIYFQSVAYWTRMLD